jgi:hypothetical protein
MAREFLIVSERILFYFRAQAVSSRQIPESSATRYKNTWNVSSMAEHKDMPNTHREPTLQHNIFCKSSRATFGRSLSSTFFSSKKRFLQLRVRGDKAIEKFTIPLTKNQSFIRTRNNRDIVLRYEVKVSTSYVYLKMIASEVQL